MALVAQSHVRLSCNGKDACSRDIFQSSRHSSNFVWRASGVHSFEEKGQEHVRKVFLLQKWHIVGIFPEHNHLTLLAKNECSFRTFSFVHCTIPRGSLRKSMPGFPSQGSQRNGALDKPGGLILSCFSPSFDPEIPQCHQRPACSNDCLQHVEGPARGSSCARVRSRCPGSQQVR